MIIFLWARQGYGRRADPGQSLSCLLRPAIAKKKGREKKRKKFQGKEMSTACPPTSRLRGWGTSSFLFFCVNDTRYWEATCIQRHKATQIAWGVLLGCPVPPETAGVFRDDIIFSFAFNIRGAKGYTWFPAVPEYLADGEKNQCEQPKLCF